MVFLLGRPRRRSWSGFAGPSRARTGACQAPHTTAILSKPSFCAARICCRMKASRSASLPRAGGDWARSAVIAWRMPSKRPAASRRCSIWCSHQSSRSSYPAASASRPSGSSCRSSSFSSPAVFSIAIWIDCGRSMNRAGTPFSNAQRSACHSGEKPANG